LDDGTMRPSMNDVVWMLEFALQLQVSAEQREPQTVPHTLGRGNDDVDGERIDENDNDVFSSGSDVGIVSDFNKTSAVSVSTISTGSTSGDHSYGYNRESVFSEIMDPKAR